MCIAPPEFSPDATFSEKSHESTNKETGCLLPPNTLVEMAAPP